MSTYQESEKTCEHSLRWDKILISVAEQYCLFHFKKPLLLVIGSNTKKANGGILQTLAVILRFLVLQKIFFKFFCEEILKNILKNHYYWSECSSKLFLKSRFLIYMFFKQFFKKRKFLIEVLQKIHNFSSGSPSENI